MKPANIALAAAGALGFILILMFGIPLWNVWRQGLMGKGALQRAEQEKRIAVEQARAEVEAAKLRAEAIKIVGAATKEHPEYRLQEFIGAFADAMQNGAIEKIIYVPTEANIPIVEAREQ